jgi:hypothetical protein
MYILALVTTTILLIFTYLYIYRRPSSFTVRKRRLDLGAQAHKFVDIGDHMIDHCGVAEDEPSDMRETSGLRKRAHQPSQ